MKGRFPPRRRWHGPLVLAAVALLLVVTAALDARRSHAQSVSAWADLPATAQALIAASAHAFLADLRPQPTRPANGLGYDCLAATALARAGVAGGKERALRSVADLLASAMPRPDGALAWRATSNPVQEAKCGPGGWESFGVCNGPDTAYGFQSGLAIACLAETAALTHDDHLVEMAKRSLHYWDRFRGVVPGCDRCLYYWESDVPAARHRYVRNLSLFLGFADAVVARVAGEAGLAATARAVARSDIWEESNGNHGYLGRLDPLWQRPGEADRVENHAAAVAMLLEAIGRDAAMPEARAAGLAVWRQFATCHNQQCRANGCDYWAADPARCDRWSTYSHCAFRQRSGLADRLCREALARAKSLSPDALIAIIAGRR
jgi:hypothetical protein